MSRDFLEMTAAPSSSSASPDILAALGTHSTLLGKVLRELEKDHPTVRCTTKVQPSNTIADTKSHKVYFSVGGKDVRIYKLLAYSTYSTTVILSFDDIANSNDGIPMVSVAGTGIILLENALVLDLAYIMVTELAGSSCIVNGPANSTNGGFFLYGWTIPWYD